MVALQEGKMNQILLCDWVDYPSWQDGTSLPSLDYSFFYMRRQYSLCHTINLLFAKLIWSRWLDIGIDLLFLILDFICMLAHKRAVKEVGQYQITL